MPEQIKGNKAIVTPASIPTTAYQCQTCPKKFTSSVVYIKHVLMHDKAGDTPPMFNCEQCTATFDEKFLLNGHMKDVHGRALQDGIWTQYQVVEDFNGVKQFCCNVCNKFFTKRNHFSQHYKHVHLRKRPKEYQCRMCPEKFTATRRATHLKEAHNITPPTCNICDRTFSYPFELLKHQKVIHLNEKNYVCDICAKAFPRAHNVLKHRRSHLNERPYLCRYCSKAFKYSNNLKCHLRALHPKKYACPICDEECVLEDEVKKHIIEDHPELVD